MNAQTFGRQPVGRFASRRLWVPFISTALTLTLTLASLLAMPSLAARAAEDTASRKVIFVTINAGESYVITDLGGGATPAIHVVENPHALLIHSDKSGQVVLLGAEAGQWSIDVTDSSGQALRYTVRVNAIASPFSHPLRPGANPPALGTPYFSGSAAAPVKVATLDPSAGLPRRDRPPVLSPPAPPPPVSPAGSSPALSALAPAAESSSSLKPPTAPSMATPAMAVPSSPLPSSAVIASSAAAPALPPSASSPTPPMLAAASAPSPPATALPAGPPPNAPSSPGFAASPLLPSQSPPGEVEQYRNNPAVRPRSPSVSGGDHYLPSDVVELPSGSSRVIDFQHRIRRISIADSSVADVQVITPYQINLIGHKDGFTTLAVWDLHGNYEERQVRVDPYGRQQVMLNVIVAELDRSRLEQQGINWAMSLPQQGISLVGLPGQVATPYNPTVSLTPQEVLGAGSPTQTVVSSTAAGTLPLTGQLIPLLLSSTINYGLAAGNSNFQTQFFFQSLENHNFAKILAEPRLMANSGEKAEFLSGGEIPIVVAQALNTSIVFKKFGTSVVFVPTVIGTQDIQLEVMPEVSQPDYAHSVQLFGFSVPAFVTRTARTSVRLRDRETLIIAGLILHTKTSAVQKTPYLGDMPYLGALFRTTSYNDQENDLVMTVTPEIVGPIPPNGVAAYPTDRGPLSPAEIQTHPLYPADASRPRF